MRENTLICFSPTGTTRAVINAVSHGIGAQAAKIVDLTKPGAAQESFDIAPDCLALIGAPVYAGRLPADSVARFGRVDGRGAPAVVVVVYGNRAYDDALLELWDLALARGFSPVAAGAFIGEHSFSSSDRPIAVGRPDAADLEQARAFGRRVACKLRDVSLLSPAPRVAVPGNHPYKARGPALAVSPESSDETCVRCGRCASVCPVGAIAVGEAVATRSERCVRCHACVKICTTGARQMHDERVLAIADRLCAACQERREPELYL